MARIGIVGGLGPESTIAYYRLFVEAGHRDLVIRNADVDRLLAWMSDGDLASVTSDLAAAVGTLADAGCDVGLIAANTPHIVFDALKSQVPIPMVSIVEAAADRVASLGLTRAALLGTRYTMEGRFYPEVFERRGLALVTPNADERAFIHDVYLNELLKNVFLDDTRARLVEIIDALREREGIEAVILGGTELPLILTGASHRGLPLLDTTAIHVRAALSFPAALPTD